MHYQSNAESTDSNAKWRSYTSHERNIAGRDSLTIAFQYLFERIGLVDIFTVGNNADIYILRYNMRKKSNRGNMYRVLKETRLKEMYIVRYADDFKIFCRKRSDKLLLHDLLRNIYK